MSAPLDDWSLHQYLVIEDPHIKRKDGLCISVRRPAPAMETVVLNVRSYKTNSNRKSINEIIITPNFQKYVCTLQGTSLLLQEY